MKADDPSCIYISLFIYFLYSFGSDLYRATSIFSFASLVVASWRRVM
jgi:hypothetical protein